jgi:hypothetical protein
MRKICFILLAAVFLFLHFPGTGNSAIEIMPNSYNFDKATDVGSYAYHDETGVQLIDGEYGITPWQADLGHGHAYEWVGWLYDSPVNIDFDFGAPTRVDSIHVGSVQDYPSDVVLPSIAISSRSGSSPWTLEQSLFVPESNTNNYTYRTFSFDNLDINAQFVQVSLYHSWDGPWTFTDEIDFYQETPPVPVPSTLLLLLSGIIGMVVIKRKFA